MESHLRAEQQTGDGGIFHPNSRAATFIEGREAFRAESVLRGTGDPFDIAAFPRWERHAHRRTCGRGRTQQTGGFSGAPSSRATPASPS